MPLLLTGAIKILREDENGDELLLYLSGLLLPPTHVWVMGYTSDNDHCYAILAPREPYTLPADAAGLWALGKTLNPATSVNHLTYRIVKSGRSNRTGESIQSLSTMDKSNLIPELKNDFKDVLSITAQRYRHDLTQVSAANSTSDSFNIIRFSHRIIMQYGHAKVQQFFGLLNGPFDPHLSYLCV